MIERVGVDGSISIVDDSKEIPEAEAAAQLKLCLGRWEGAQSVMPPLMVVPLPLMKPERRGGGSNPLHPGYASASADVAGHKRMAKGFLRHSESAVSGKDGEMGEREETASQTSASSATQHKTANVMRCKGGIREGSRKGVRACAALSIIIVIFGCIHRIVHAHSALCMHPPSSSLPLL